MVIAWRTVRVGHIRKRVPSSWDALSRRQLIHLAGLALAGLDAAALQLAFGLYLLGLRLVRPEVRNGQRGSLVRSRWGLLGWMDVFALHNARTLADFVCGPADSLASLRTRNPYPRRGRLQGWSDGLADVRLDELLLAIDIHQALARTDPSDAEARRAALYALLGVVWRRRKHGERQALEDGTPQGRSDDAAAAFGPEAAQVALWYVEGSLAMIAKRFPRLFGSDSSEGNGSAAPHPPAVGLVYALARGCLEQIPRIRQAWAWDALLMLDALAEQAERSPKTGHASP